MADRDVLVIGQGLAGTTLAWALLLRGNPPLVMDGHTGSAASRVAAGLLAPVGGKRLGVAWRAEQAWPAALPFYRSIEAKLGVDLLQEAPVVRLFVDKQQKDEFRRRATGPLSDWAIDGDSGIGPEFYAPLGGCQVIGGRLDVDRYLDASRAEFARLGLLIDRNLDDPGELDESSAGVSLRAIDLTVSHVVLCRGLAEQGFCPLPFEPAKGETLTVRAPRLSEQRVVQRGVWLASLGENLFRVGATFDRCSNDQKPTVKGRQELEAKLNDFIRVPYAVVDQSAGVRPILKSRRPIAGLLPGRTRIGVFNGLGASGSLWAPWVAGQYAQHLLFGDPLDSEVDASVRLANCR